QAEDGIRDFHVTGVQTCALPIYLTKAKQHLERASVAKFDDASIDLAILLFSENTAASNKTGLQKLQPLISKGNMQAIHAKALYRSEERRVGKECRSRWSTVLLKK